VVRRVIFQAINVTIAHARNHAPLLRCRREAIKESLSRERYDQPGIALEVEPVSHLPAFALNVLRQRDHLRRAGLRIESYQAFISSIVIASSGVRTNPKTGRNQQTATNGSAESVIVKCDAA